MPLPGCPTLYPLCRKAFLALSGHLSGAVLTRKPLCPMALRVLCRVSGGLKTESEEGARGGLEEEDGHRTGTIRAQ